MPDFFSFAEKRFDAVGEAARFGRSQGHSDLLQEVQPARDDRRHGRQSLVDGDRGRGQIVRVLSELRADLLDDGGQLHRFFILMLEYVIAGAFPDFLEDVFVHLIQDLHVEDDLGDLLVEFFQVVHERIAVSAETHVQHIGARVVVCDVHDRLARWTCHLADLAVAAACVGVEAVDLLLARHAVGGDEPGVRVEVLMLLIEADGDLFLPVGYLGRVEGLDAHVCSSRLQCGYSG
jgi:hypothetical protein